MKDYMNGFRHITVFAESEEQEVKLNAFLNENHYNYEESRDAVMVMAKEVLGTNENVVGKMRQFMTRVSADEAQEFEESIYEKFCDSVDEHVNYAVSLTDDVILEFATKDLETIEKGVA